MAVTGYQKGSHMGDAGGVLTEKRRAKIMGKGMEDEGLRPSRGDYGRRTARPAGHAFRPWWSGRSSGRAAPGESGCHSWNRAGCGGLNREA